MKIVKKMKNPEDEEEKETGRRTYKNLAMEDVESRRGFGLRRRTGKTRNIYEEEEASRRRKKSGRSQFRNSDEEEEPRREI